MASNRLRLNPDKTQFIWFGTRQQLAKQNCDRLSSVSPTLVFDTHVRNLGVILDSELQMGDHISQLCRSCFFQLRRLRAIRHSLTQKSILMLAHSFICNRIDYCNSVLYGASRFQLDHLQSILNAAARIILRIQNYSHISASIRDELHWLPVRFRPEFKICLFVRNCLVGTAPAYLQELCIASFFKRRPSEPSISKSRGPCCPKSGYNSIWAAWLLCVWAGHLEFPTAGGSTNHEQCWTVQEKVENILHAKVTLTPLRIHIERVYLINQSINQPEIALTKFLAPNYLWAGNRRFKSFCLSLCFFINLFYLLYVE